MLRQIHEAGKRIECRFSAIHTHEDFLATEEGLDRLDAICMMLIAIGESIKNLVKFTLLFEQASMILVREMPVLTS